MIGDGDRVPPEAEARRAPAPSALTWVLHTDLVSVSRGRAVVDYDRDARPPPTVGWVPADLGLDAFGGLVDTPWGPVGELRLRPDPTTFVEVDPNPGRRPPLRFVLATCTDGGGAEWPACPRGVLRRAVDQLAAEFGLQILAGFEHEFALARPEAPLPFSLDAARRAEPLLSDIVAALGRAELDPEHILPEFGHNQFEATIEPSTGLAAADRAVMTREVIREVARAAEERVTFAPVVGTGAGTNGAHVHLSLLDDAGRPINEATDRPHGLSDRARAFAAGVMAHLPGLTAITAPSVASYLRLRPRSWSAAFRIYGIENREAALRLAPGRPQGGGGRTRLGPSLELRSCDATANPYLVLAALITAGMDGLRRGLELGDPVNVDPAGLTSAERAERGITELPRSLGASLAALEMDKELRTMLGPDLEACWFAIKGAEIERFAAASTAEIIEAYADAY